MTTKPFDGQPLENSIRTCDHIEQWLRSQT